MAERSILTGTCGFPIARQKYFRQFPCIEVNITFYQLPGIETAERWRREAEAASPGFEFIVKAWQLITHPVNPVTYRRLRERLDPQRRHCYGFFRDTPEVRQAWVRTAEFCRALGARKVLFQTPPTFKPSDENLRAIENFFGGMDRKGFTFLFEPRGEAWSGDIVGSACRESGLVHAVDPLYSVPSHGVLRYYRLHGVHTGSRLDYDHSFSTGELRRALGTCDLKQNYVMFNNSTMYRNAAAFQRMTR